MTNSKKLDLANLHRGHLHASGFSGRAVGTCGLRNLLYTLKILQDPKECLFM